MPQKQSGYEGDRMKDLYSLLKRRGFFWPSYEIYGGVAGFFDLGPLGSLMRDNVESLWKDVFILQERFLLLDSPSIAPEEVYRASGHLERFSDIMTRCGQCGSPFRADHLLEDRGVDVESITIDKAGAALTEHGVRCPNCGGELTEPEEFNLMFQTFIGPGREKRGFLRPETAQTIFMDFGGLYRFNRERLPFGVAQLGRGFRNEISPRQGLLRQREFNMAEAEYFYDPKAGEFSPFDRIKEREVVLIPNTGEMSITTLGDGISEGILSSRILAYFMAVTLDFALRAGIPDEKMRFRQHRTDEMAHYSRDCWDLEIETSNGWIEAVGVADRSAYDLEQHTEHGNTELSAIRKYEQPRTVSRRTVIPDMKALGPIFKGRAREVASALEATDPDTALKAREAGSKLALDIGGEEIAVPADAYTVECIEERSSGERFIPNVIEPSFGIDRIMVGILENSYIEAKSSPMKGEGEGEEGPYRVLRLKPGIAPIKVGIFPLMNKGELPGIAQVMDGSLRKAGQITCYDASGSIGRRYARMDEVGTPFCVTVDFDTVKDGSVTLRERDSGIQVRMPGDDVCKMMRDLAEERSSFDELKERYPVVKQ